VIAPLRLVGLMRGQIRDLFVSVPHEIAEITSFSLVKAASQKRGDQKKRMVLAGGFLSDQNVQAHS
jgi:hypothetical protein